MSYQNSARSSSVAIAEAREASEAEDGILLTAGSSAEPSRVG